MRSKVSRNFVLLAPPSCGEVSANKSANEGALIFIITLFGSVLIIAYHPPFVQRFLKEPFNSNYPRPEIPARVFFLEAVFDSGLAGQVDIQTITVLSADLSKRLPLVSNDELTANAEIKARSQRTGFEVKLVHSDFCLT